MCLHHGWCVCVCESEKETASGSASKRETGGVVTGAPSDVCLGEGEGGGGGGGRIGGEGGGRGVGEARCGEGDERECCEEGEGGGYEESDEIEDDPATQSGASGATYMRIYS